MNYEYMYCYFCETQKCSIISQIFEKAFNVYSISPTIIQREWKEGKCRERIHNYLPGYIFLYSDEPLPKYYPISGIIRRLGDQNGTLSPEDQAFAQMLHDHNGMMGIINLVEVNQHCKVADPLWEKMEGIVTKIDRGRKRCCVEFTFDSKRHKVWLGYELVQLIQ